MWIVILSREHSPADKQSEVILEHSFRFVMKTWALFSVERGKNSAVC